MLLIKAQINYFCVDKLLLTHVIKAEDSITNFNQCESTLKREQIVMQLQ